MRRPVSQCPLCRLAQTPNVRRQADQFVLAAAQGFFAAQGLAAAQGFFAAQGLTTSVFLAAQGLHGLQAAAFCAAQGLQGLHADFFAAAQGLQVA